MTSSTIEFTIPSEYRSDASGRINFFSNASLGFSEDTFLTAKRLTVRVPSSSTDDSLTFSGFESNIYRQDGNIIGVMSSSTDLTVATDVVVDFQSRVVGGRTATMSAERGPYLQYPQEPAAGGTCSGICSLPDGSILTTDTDGNVLVFQDSTFSEGLKTYTYGGTGTAPPEFNWNIYNSFNLGDSIVLNGIVPGVSKAQTWMYDTINDTWANVTTSFPGYCVAGGISRSTSQSGNIAVFKYSSTGALYLMYSNATVENYINPDGHADITGLYVQPLAVKDNKEVFVNYTKPFDGTDTFSNIYLFSTSNTYAQLGNSFVSTNVSGTINELIYRDEGNIWARGPDNAGLYKYNETTNAWVFVDVPNMRVTELDFNLAEDEYSLTTVTAYYDSRTDKLFVMGYLNALEGNTWMDTTNSIPAAQILDIQTNTWSPVVGDNKYFRTSGTTVGPIRRALVTSNNNIWMGAGTRSLGVYQYGIGSTERTFNFTIDLDETNGEVVFASATPADTSSDTLPVWSWVLIVIAVLLLGYAGYRVYAMNV